MGYESWRFYVAWRSQPDSTAPQWENETGRVDTAVMPITVQRGRQSERDDITPSTLQLALNNKDHRYTPGNPDSDLYPYVLPARRCKVVDFVGGVEYPIFDGYIEFPEIDTWQKATEEAPREQTITITAVDRLGRLDRARPFVSTLGEHIRANGGGTLRAHYPMNEASTPFIDVISGLPSLRPQSLVDLQLAGTYAGSPQVLPGEADGPPGDDVPMAGYEVEWFDTGSATIISRSVAGQAVYPSDLLPLATGECVTVCAWLRPRFPAVNSIPTAMRLELNDSAGADWTILQLVINPNTTDFGDLELTLGVTSGASGSIPLTGVWANEAWLPVAMRYGADPEVLELWVRHAQYTTTITGTPPTTNYLSKLLAPNRRYAGDIGRVQIYIGDPDLFTFDDWSAQVDAGHAGLTRQLVDERITTLAGYAGIATTDLDVDRGAAVLAPATLAGRRPSEEMREAAGTDRGLLFCLRDGRIAFRTRGRRYSPLPAAVVDLSWLEDPLPVRTDPPGNVADVTSTAGYEGHAVDAGSVAEFGEYAADDLPHLDTAVDADPQNLADFTVYTRDRPRQRVPQYTFQLRWMDDATKATILGREIGDWCQLSSRPSNFPEGAGSFHIEGIGHQISVLGGHVVGWNTGPVLGAIPGVPDPYPLVDESEVSDQTVIPF